MQNNDKNFVIIKTKILIDNSIIVGYIEDLSKAAAQQRLETLVIDNNTGSLFGN